LLDVLPHREVQADLKLFLRVLLPTTASLIDSFDIALGVVYQGELNLGA
jgi:hypothetical protein